MPRLRLVAYNVHGFRAGVRRVAEAVAAERPDVVLLNEARFRWRVRRLARLLGMQAAHGLRLFRPITNAVLVGPPWRVVERRVVPLSRTLRLKRRGAVVARAGGAGFRVTAVCVHLGVSDPERVRHAKELTDLLAGLPSPLVLGGDLNEGPERPAVSWIAARLWDAFAAAGEGPAETFPSSAPRARIDYLFVSEGVAVQRARVGGDAEASDHLPVVADVELPEG